MWTQLPVTELIVCFVAVIDGRFCEELTTEHGKVSCCLPCPLAEWTYGESKSTATCCQCSRILAHKNLSHPELISQTKVASWLGVATLPLCIFLLVSFAVLPPKWTHRHYLSICFTLGICCMEVGRLPSPINCPVLTRFPDRLHHPARSQAGAMLQPNHPQ